MNQDNPPPYSAVQGPYNPPGAHQPPPPGIKPDFNPPPTHHIQEPVTQTHVVVQHVQHVALGPNPQHMICPSCHAQITTSVTTEPNTKTHLFALLLCLFQCYLCCCIPYCVDSCQSQNHYCPNCKAFLGAFNN